jgi:restriction system protein
LGFAHVDVQQPLEVRVRRAVALLSFARTQNPWYEYVMSESEGAWTVRAGKHGERDAWALTNSLCGGGWQDIPDLSPIGSREEVGGIVEGIFGTEQPGLVSNYTGQLWALRSRILEGDLIVLPLKTTSQIALGTVTRTYFYNSAEPDLSRRHCIGVDWKRVDVARTAIRQDLLFTLGSALTVFQSRRHEALWRLEQVLATGTDPGAREAPDFMGASGSFVDEDDGVGSSVGLLDLEDLGLTRIQSLIQERFKGHDLARLVEAVLVADGFQCERKPPGPDGGVDILAGCGTLGLNSPRIVVQVKSDNNPVGDPVVQTLQGAISRFGADQALLVAWGGVNKNAQKSLQPTKFSIRLWDSADLMNAIFRTYAHFPEELRAELPLRQIWIDVPPPSAE